MFQTLDVGCGFIQGKHKVDGNVGVDVRKGICHIQCDAHYLPFKHKVFSHVNLIAVLEHLDKPLMALREALRVAKDKATFKIVVPKDARGNMIKLKQLIFEFPLSLPKIVKFYLSIPKHHPIGHKRQVNVEDIAKVLKVTNVRITGHHSWFRLLRKLFSFEPQIGMWKDLKILAVKP